MISIIYQ